jgi:Fe-S oxidoreductase
VNVDVATAKAEFLSHYYDGRLRPRHAYAFGYVDRAARFASLWPEVANFFTQTPGLNVIAKLAAGIPLQRQIPRFASTTFQRWFSRHRKAKNASGTRVLLWPDTFNNYFHSGTAIAACEFLESAGCEVVVPQQHVCCGRPLYDFGMLDRAKVYLKQIMHTFADEIDRGTPIVVLEPSCASVFRDELINLFPKDVRAQKLAKQVFLLSEFLEKHPEIPLPKLDQKILLHGHCHHKSLMKMASEHAVLKRMAADVDEPESGCCGMAGSFGYEKDKYDISVKIGERVLLPRVREADRETLIMTDGFSCRSQIEQLTDRHAVHLADALQQAQGGQAFQDRPSVKRTVAAVAVAAAGLSLLYVGWRRRQSVA